MTKPHDDFPRTLSVAPGAMGKVDLGTYSQQEAKPHFEVSYSLKDHEVVLHELVIEGRSSYHLYYQFQNFGQKPVQVTVTQQ